jgi:cytochrome c oxidase assembly protein subunit 11
MDKRSNDTPAKNRRVALAAAALAASMVGLAYASVPLYKLFCATTGFGGTTQRAAAAPAQSQEQMVTVRFDANTAPSLLWSFHPVQNAMQVKLGEQAMAHYEATNLSTKTLTGTAVFNVSPPEAGAYFTKIQCFCFNEQTLKPGQRVDMPVVYFVDPSMLEDADTKALREITLSYTFYPVETPAADQAASLQLN